MSKIIYPEFHSGREGKFKKTSKKTLSINKPSYLIVHHTGGTDANPLADTSNQSFKIVDDYHKKLWNFKSSLGYYIGYHYFIDKAGKLTQGRADTDEGAHTIGKNLVSLGICMAGNFDATLPTQAQIDTLSKLLANKMTQYNIPLEKIVPHRKFASKTCYGNKLTEAWVISILKPEIKKKILELHEQTGKLLAML